MSETNDKYSHVTRVGPGTPMGEVFRRFWLPVAISQEVAERDCAPRRIRILCEDLVLFRDTKGRLGLISAYCPHRRAPLFFGRNEECGLRCVYHGWKFDVDGNCLDIPNVIPPDNFEQLKDRARVKSYPVQEAGGMVWTYMGPKEDMPPLPAMEWLDLPQDQIHSSRWLHRSNWLQAMEGEIDSSHISFLHSELEVDEDAVERHSMARDGKPEITIRDTDYGFVYGARRNFEDKYYWRVTHWMLPMWSAIPSQIKDFIGNGRGWVPIDDYHTMGFAYRYRPDKALSEEERKVLESGAIFPPRGSWGTFKLPDGYIIDAFIPDAVPENDYFIDRQDQKTRTFSGIWGVNEQDRALQECMPGLPGDVYGIVDRNQEMLVKADLSIMAARRVLGNLAKKMEQGEPPKAAKSAESYSVRAIVKITDIADFDEFMKAHGDEGFVHKDAAE